MTRQSIGRVLADVVSLQRSGDVSDDVLRRHEVELVDRALHHRVPGPLAAAYRARALEVPVQLRSGQIAASVSRMTALHDLEFVNNVLAGRDIDLLVFKGQVLTTLVSGDEWERPTLDLDVLVPGRDLEQAVDLLIAAGAVHLDRNWPKLRDDVLGELHLVLPAGTALDLHWHLLVRASMRSGFTPDHDALFATSRTVDLDGTEVRTFGPAETLVYSCFHGAISGGHLLVWLVDIERLVVNDRPDWADVIRVARAWRCGLVVGAMLQRTRRELGLDVPSDVLAQLMPGMVTRRTLAGFDRIRAVGDVAGDGPWLRLITRSIDVDGWSTLRSLIARPAQRAYRAARRRPQPSAVDYFVDTCGEHHRDERRSEYFEAVRLAAR